MGWEVLGAQAAPKVEFPSAMEASSSLLLLLALRALWAGEWELSKGETPEALGPGCSWVGLTTDWKQVRCPQKVTDGRNVGHSKREARLSRDLEVEKSGHIRADTLRFFHFDLTLILQKSH